MTAFTIDNVGPTGANGAAALLSWRAVNYGGTTSQRFLFRRYVDLAVSAVETPSKTPISTAGVLRNLLVGGDAAIGGGVSATYTVRVNGVDTALTVTLSSGTQSGSDTTHSVSVSPGDQVSLSTLTSGTNGSNMFPAAALEFAP